MIIHNKVVIFLLSLLFIFIGLGLLFFSYIFLSSTQKFIKNSLISNGTVIDIVQRANTDTNGSMSYTYSPKISFIAADGQEYIFISATSSNPSPYYKGENVKVLYSPKNPYNAKINNFFDLWGITITFFGAGAVFSIMSIFMIIFSVKNLSQNNQLQKNAV